MINERLSQQANTVQQRCFQPSERADALDLLVHQILQYPRRICRPFQGQPLSGIYQEIFNQVRAEIWDCLDQTIDRYDLQHLSADDLRSELQMIQDAAFRKVLSDAILTQLALAAQSCPSKSEQRKYALRELIEAIRLMYFSRLSRLSQLPEEAINRTFSHTCEKIDQFDAERGQVMAWFNLWLQTYTRKIRQEQLDPLIESQWAKILRIKSELIALVRRSRQEDVTDWIALMTQGRVSNLRLGAMVTQLLVASFLLSHLLKIDRSSAESLFLAIAEHSLATPSFSRALEFSGSGENGEWTRLENLPQPSHVPFLSEQLQQYLSEDPDQILQEHIKGFPTATFQKIALSYLNQKPWKELSQELGISIPTLSSFYRRQLQNLAPKIKKYLQA